MATARFIYDVPLKNVDMFYATRFISHDPIAFFQYNNKKYLVVDALEFDRAKKEATVNKVLLASHYKENLEIRKGNVVDIMSVIFKEHKINTLLVPPNFPLVVADEFRKRKYKLVIGQIPFVPERTQKTLVEKKAMIEAQKNTFKLIRLVEETLSNSRIKNNKLYFKGKVLTSEFVRELLSMKAIQIGCVFSSEPIIACGDQGIDPHCTGTGILRPHAPIVVDIFPTSSKSFFCGDATRTFCKGKTSPELKKQYHTVKCAQEMAIKNIRAGVNGKDIHTMVFNFFESKGYKTGQIDGRQQGFFHGTGHGIGLLEIHEVPPHISTRDYILKPGNVTSVEPGLYYKKTGGVRIEDLVYVTKTGCEVLGYYPKRLEIP